MEKFSVISSPREIYKKMLDDINSAKKSIYLETYIFSKDEIGNQFRDALIKKAKEGIKVFVLIDGLGSGDLRIRLHKLFRIDKSLGFGAGLDKKYFKELVNNKGEIRFFKDIRYVLRLFSSNHERNHRKLLIVDNKISYIGSVNITSSCLDWRELVLRLEGEIAAHFIDSFNYHWELANKEITRKKIKLILHKGFEILQDLPGDKKMLTEGKYRRLINNAKKDILIETPYLIPPWRIRRALERAVKRGVEVKLLLPYNSDIKILDIVRDRYLGRFYKKGIKIYYYAGILHSKLLLVDNKFFILGSSNLDYRALIHQYEINILGRDKKIITSLKNYFNSGLKHSNLFDYEEWKSRSSIRKVMQHILTRIKNYL
jgi:cardiolipin synthase